MVNRPVDQKPILGRKDVLCYVSERLEYPVGICGPVELDLWVGSDAEDTDFIAKLCVVDREQKGRMFCLTYGSLRCRYRSSWAEPEPLERDEPTRIRIRMQPTAQQGCPTRIGSEHRRKRTRDLEKR